MASERDNLESLVNRRYEHGFVTDIATDSLPPGLDEDIVTAISAKKDEPEFMLEWRLKAYRHWLTMQEPDWAHVHYPKIDYQDISYFSAPKSDEDRPKSLDEVDPKLLETYDKLGIPLHERARLAGVAIDAVFDSVSVANTRNSSGNISARWFRIVTISSRHSIRRYSVMAPLYTSRKACAARWNCPPISASTRRKPGNSREP
jgi:Fe-S cluster assembly protein SufB